MEKFFTEFRYLHILAAVLYLGNLIVTSMWKLQADRSGSAELAGFGNRLLQRTDRLLMGPSAFVVLMTGGMLPTAGGYGFKGQGWVHFGATLFVVSAAIWLFAMRPLQRKQRESLAGLTAGSALSEDYRAMSRRWAMWSGIATLLPIVAIWLMVDKPFQG